MISQISCLCKWVSYTCKSFSYLWNKVSYNWNWISVWWSNILYKWNRFQKYEFWNHMNAIEYQTNENCFHNHLFFLYSASIIVPCRSDQFFKNRMVVIDYIFSKSDKIGPLFNIYMLRFKQNSFKNKMSWNWNVHVISFFRLA